jgi:PEGA domain
MPVQASTFGTLVIRVQPTGADILIDGDRWSGPEGDDRLLVQVSEGMHHIEVRKTGYLPFTADVPIRRGETTPLNVSLPPEGR